MTKYNSNRALKLGISMLLVLASLLLNVSCGDGGKTPSPSKQELLTSGLWTLTSVTLDNVDKTSDFDGMTLQFDASTYTSSNGNLVWPDQGVWTLLSGRDDVFVRGDDVQVTIESITKSSLTLTLTWAGTLGSGGRSASVAGQYRFDFVK